MQLFEKQEFARFYDQDSGRTFSGIEFRKCSFLSSSVSITRDPKLRSTVRDVKLIQCEQRGCALNAAIVEDVLVDGFKTNGLFQTWGAVFKHVTLRGKIGRVMISPYVAPSTATEKQQWAFDEANAAYYAGVDWALDISEAEFEEVDIRRLSARLVRRDPTTQVVVTRERAMEGRWRTLDLSRTDWAGWIDLFLKDGDPDLVLAAPKRHRSYRDLLDGLKALRDAGVAEPD
jgi:hypothetical protein